MIVAAAIRLGELISIVPRPGRHHNVISALAKAGVPIPIGGHGLEDEQGFIDHEGNFLNRREALDHVLAIRQPTRSLVQNEKLGLFSEDLW